MFVVVRYKFRNTLEKPETSMACQWFHLFRLFYYFRTHRHGLTRRTHKMSKRRCCFNNYFDNLLALFTFIQQKHSNYIDDITCCFPFILVFYIQHKSIILFFLILFEELKNTHILNVTSFYKRCRESKKSIRLHT